jgi:hypothetical protein
MGTVSASTVIRKAKGLINRIIKFDPKETELKNKALRKLTAKDKAELEKLQDVIRLLDTLKNPRSSESAKDEASIDLRRLTYTLEQAVSDRTGSVFDRVLLALINDTEMPDLRDEGAYPISLRPNLSVEQEQILQGVLSRVADRTSPPEEADMDLALVHYLLNFPLPMTRRNDNKQPPRQITESEVKEHLKRLVDDRVSL